MPVKNPLIRSLLRDSVPIEYDPYIISGPLYRTGVNLMGWLERDGEEDDEEGGADKLASVLSHISISINGNSYPLCKQGIISGELLKDIDLIHRVRNHIWNRTGWTSAIPAPETGHQLPHGLFSVWTDHKDRLWALLDNHVKGIYSDPCCEEAQYRETEHYIYTMFNVVYLHWPELSEQYFLKSFHASLLAILPEDHIAQIPYPVPFPILLGIISLRLRIYLLARICESIISQPDSLRY